MKIGQLLVIYLVFYVLRGEAHGLFRVFNESILLANQSEMKILIENRPKWSGASFLVGAAVTTHGPPNKIALEWLRLKWIRKS